MGTLVIGASGLVGYEFYRQNKEKSDWHYTYRSVKLDDFTCLDAVDKEKTKQLIDELSPSLVIVPAAMAHVNKCETERELAYNGNVGVVKNVLSALQETTKGKIVFFSTDYLFDGEDGPYSEEAAPNPLNEYGRLKLQCEKEIINSGLEHLILRTTGIFGWEKQRKNFMYRVIDTLSAGKDLVVPNDQLANPTYVKDLVSATMVLLEKDLNGVFNVAGPEVMSRDELAVRMAKFYNLNPGLVKGVLTSELGGLAPRPLKAGLKIDKITGLGIKMRVLEEALGDMRKRKAEEDHYD